MKPQYKKFIKFISVLLIVVGLYATGYAVGHNNLVIEKNYVPKILGASTDKSKDVNFSLFWDAWDSLKNNFFGDLNSQNMVYGAISGLTKATGDPYTTYFTPDEAKRFSEDLKGNFEGIGAELENKDGLVNVVAPLDGSPAQKAGLRAQDVILKINGEDITNLGFYDVIDKIRGPKGTEVLLTVFRPSTKKNVDLKITRDTILVKSVKWEEKSGNLYIRISQFGDDTTDLFKQAAQYAIDKNYPGIIIDLRNNPGGYLESAVDISSYFIENDKVVVREQNKQGDKKQYKTTLSPILKDKKLVILVDGGSASASEIFSGAMQDYKKATLVGVKTYGKGSVQTLTNLSDGSELKITIAKWLTPNGRMIDKLGIDPDVEVKLTEDNIKNNQDPQLDKALELIK
jgi:carboxyl-terminal processing protease